MGPGSHSALCTASDEKLDESLGSRLVISEHSNLLPYMIGSSADSGGDMSNYPVNMVPSVKLWFEQVRIV